MNKKKMIPQINDDYQELIHQVGIALEDGRRVIVTSINNAMVKTYWTYWSAHSKL